MPDTRSDIRPDARRDALPASTSPALTTRLATAADQALLRVLFAEGRAHQWDQLPLDANGRAQLLELQFRLRAAHYLTHFPQAACRVIETDGQAVGCLTVDRSAQVLQLIDLAVLERWQGRGIATRLLRQLQFEAARAGQRMRLTVAVGNRAEQLYARLGFVPTTGDALHQQMEWIPAGILPDPSHQGAAHATT